MPNLKNAGEKAPKLDFEELTMTTFCHNLRTGISLHPATKTYIMNGR